METDSELLINTIEVDVMNYYNEIKNTLITKEDIKYIIKLIKYLVNNNQLRIAKTKIYIYNMIIE